MSTIPIATIENFQAFTKSIIHKEGVFENIKMEFKSNHIFSNLLDKAEICIVKVDHKCNVENDGVYCISVNHLRSIKGDICKFIVDNGRFMALTDVMEYTIPTIMENYVKCKDIPEFKWEYITFNISEEDLKRIILLVKDVSDDGNPIYLELKDNIFKIYDENLVKNIEKIGRRIPQIDLGIKGNFRTILDSVYLNEILKAINYYKMYKIYLGNDSPFAIEMCNDENKCVYMLAPRFDKDEV